MDAGRRPDASLLACQRDGAGVVPDTIARADSDDALDAGLPRPLHQIGCLGEQLGRPDVRVAVDQPQEDSIRGKRASIFRVWVLGAS